MGKPFQFSIVRMLAAMTFCCFGLGLISCRDRMSTPLSAFVIVFGSGALIGGGIGVIVRRPIICAACGGVLAILAALAYVSLIIRFDPPGR